jgi:hypothetical protein
MVSCFRHCLCFGSNWYWSECCYWHFSVVVYVPKHSKDPIRNGRRNDCSDQSPSCLLDSGFGSSRTFEQIAQRQGSPRIAGCQMPGARVPHPLQSHRKGWDVHPFPANSCPSHYSLLITRFSCHSLQPKSSFRKFLSSPKTHKLKQTKDIPVAYQLSPPAIIEIEGKESPGQKPGLPHLNQQAVKKGHLPITSIK